jgi:hypothetical protein
VDEAPPRRYGRSRIGLEYLAKGAKLDLIVPNELLEDFEAGTSDLRIEANALDELALTAMGG